VAARINLNERPIKPGTKAATNEPAQETVTKNPTKPVTSAMQTAQNLIEAAKRNHQGDTMSTIRTADGSTPPDASPDKRTDVTGVGGVIQNSNEEASKADAQVDPTGIGGTGVEGVEADSTTTLTSAPEGSDDSGFDKTKNIESIPTKTYDDSDGSQKGVTDPVTSKPFPESSVHKGYDAKPFYDQPGLSGGSANQGTQPVDPVGKAQDRVDVLSPADSPNNNSGPTKTWTGTGGNKIYKQQDPVTPGLVENNVSDGWTSHVVATFKLADQEVSLGLINEDEKYDRLAELESQSDVEIQAQLDTLSRVKVAGTKKLAQARTAGVTRLPGAFGRRTAAPNPDWRDPERTFDRVTDDEHTASQIPVDEGTLDSALFA